MPVFQRLSVVLIVLAVLLSGAPIAAQPAGFTDELVPGLGNLSQPTAFTFTPDGRMLIATKPGRLLVYANGALLPTPALDLTDRICAQSERGLLGVAVDPDFAANNQIYVYYTARTAANCQNGSPYTDAVNRVSRFTLTNNVAADERILIDNIPSPNGNHNAGDLQFGKDGYLYISVGDGGARASGARERFHMLGKILRITRDGAVPPDNPFLGDGTARCYDPAPGGNRSGFIASDLICQEIFAWGLRNPYRIAFDPNAATTRFFINDVGQGRVEEISVGRAGADYGWNCLEGSLDNATGGLCATIPPTNADPPLFEYQRSPTPPGQPSFFNGCASITAGAFVPDGLWPAAYNGAYIFADYVCDRIFSLTFSGATPTPALFLEDRTVTHMAFGPDDDSQALYVADFSGSIRAIRYVGNANRTPIAAISATPEFGSAPLTVQFDASASRDRDSGDTLVAYRWDFGDGESAVTSAPTVAHTYQTNGVYTASVIVEDNRGGRSAQAATVRIDVGNAPPAPTILSPAADERFSVGQRFILRGSAVDPEDGALSGAQLQWEVRRHHDDHFHPYLNATGAEVELVAPEPEDLPAVNTSYLEIRLTATDSLGSSTTITRALRPLIVPLEVRSIPPGLTIRVDGNTEGNTVIAPATVNSWPGYAVEFEAPAAQTLNNTQLRFCYWAHAENALQTIVTPAAGGTYTAVYAPVGAPCAAAAPGPLRLFAPMIRYSGGHNHCAPVGRAASRIST
jgi:glucose/arabinose dehydrogenase/PKD repeat protein